MSARHRQRLNYVETDIDRRIENLERIAQDRVTKTVRGIEFSLVEIAREWSEKYPNHFVYIEEAMGVIFFNIFRVRRNPKIEPIEIDFWFDNWLKNSGHEVMTEIMYPLLSLSNALTDLSDAYRIGIDFHCFYQGKSISRDKFKKLSADRGVK